LWERVPHSFGNIRRVVGAVVAIKDSIPLNFALMANPLNWIIITLMVLMGGIALHLIVNHTSEG
jgi:hypothetical protein